MNSDMNSDENPTMQTVSEAMDFLRRENCKRQTEMAASPVRMADADYVLRWVYQAGIDTIPSNIYDMSARALDFPSLAHGFADDKNEGDDFPNVGELELEPGYKPISLLGNKKIRLLKQLNRTLELVQADPNEDVADCRASEKPTIRQTVEASVLECIAMLCIPLVAVKETTTDNQVERK